MSVAVIVIGGVLGATAYTHSAGYLVTYMTGNAQRAALGYFVGDHWLSISATLVLVVFVAGVVIASLSRRHLWATHPHASTLLTTLALVVATVLDATVCGGHALPLPFLPIALVAFAIGALNTTFVKDGETSISLSYMTGTLVKMGQGIERHISGGAVTDWLGYFLLLTSFIGGAAVGGAISLVTGGTQMLGIASVICALTSGYTFFYADRRAIWR